MTSIEPDLLRDLARAGCGAADLTPLPPGMGVGVRVKTTDTHHIDVVAQLVNWRVRATRLDQDHPRGSYAAAYCYYGRSVDSYLRAVLGALVWDGPGSGHPPGWQKNVLTGEYSDTARAEP